MPFKLGSPPRVRGKAEVRHERDQEPGITPACAGKRHCPRFRPGKTRDHPRVCGEKDAICKSCPARQGSPPRMRGKGPAAATDLPGPGITPAYAGKSTSASLRISWSRDHPRVCGEKIRVASPRITQRGSPPRMRGKGGSSSFWRLLVRITPAYAGKSSSGVQGLSS